MNQRLQLVSYIETKYKVLLYDELDAYKSTRKRYDGVYTRQLKYALNVSWKHWKGQKTNKELYGKL